MIGALRAIARGRRDRRAGAGGPDAIDTAIAAGMLALGVAAAALAGLKLF